MFSGIIEAIGEVKAIQKHGNEEHIDWRFVIDAASLNLEALESGDSVAINGVCLTVISQTGSLLEFDVSAETLSCTGFESLSVASSVNLERALMVSERLNGHIVSGHVDCVGEVSQYFEDARSWRFEFRVPGQYMRYIAAKGSVTIDGVSLTVNSVEADTFSVNIIPHTYEQTIFKQYETGTIVNIEVDLLARYVEKLLESRDL